MTDELTKLLRNHPQATSTAEDDIFFGDNKDVRVVLLRKTDSLLKLHFDTIELLEQGGWKPNAPHYAKDGFLPHSTVQSHARINKGDEVIFNTLSIVDFFPNEDPYQRKILTTIPLQAKK